MWAVRIFYGQGRILKDMAEEELVERVNVLVRKGLSESLIRQQLEHDGWTKEDINGALAVHSLSLKPIGSNLMNRWEDSKEKRKAGTEEGIFRLVLLVLLLLALILCVDYNGITLPFFEQGTLRKILDNYMGMIVSGL